VAAIIYLLAGAIAGAIASKLNALWCIYSVSSALAQGTPHLANGDTGNQRRNQRIREYTRIRPDPRAGSIGNIRGRGGACAPKCDQPLADRRSPGQSTPLSVQKAIAGMITIVRKHQIEGHGAENTILLVYIPSVPPWASAACLSGRRDKAESGVGVSGR
jgi:hypothetical protein